MNEYKTLTILRGISGSGKSSFASFIAKENSVICCADDFFTDRSGKYNFDASKLWAAHSTCQEKCLEAMKNGLNVIIANTNTTAKEMKPYRRLAEQYGYRVFIITVENHHGGENIHQVPQEVLDKQRERLQNSIKL